jgi:tetratricopeptide (TPR) repeat protein
MMRRQVMNAVDAGEGDLETRRLRARVASDPADLKSRLELARRYDDLGYPELAVEHCRVAAERFPSAPAVQELLARTLRAMGLPKEAAASLDGYLASARPLSPALYSWLGILRDDLKDFRSAEQAHRKAVEMNPRSDVFHNNLGNNLLLQNRAAEAAVEFREALRLSPRSDVARNNLGVAIASQPGEAILVWESAGDPASAHNNLAVVLMEQEKYQEARKELEIALGYRRDHPAALNNLRLVAQADGAPVTVPAHNQNPGFWKRFGHSLRLALLGEAEPPKSGAAESASR